MRSSASSRFAADGVVVSRPRPPRQCSSSAADRRRTAPGRGRRRSRRLPPVQISDRLRHGAGVSLLERQRSPQADPPPEPMWVSAADVDVGYMSRAPARQPRASPATVGSLPEPGMWLIEYRSLICSGRRSVTASVAVLLSDRTGSGGRVTELQPLSRPRWWQSLRAATRSCSVSERVHPAFAGR